MDLLLHIDRNAPKPLHNQLYDQLREAILDGRLKENARLPSSRRLALDLGVSRFTVNEAFTRLLDEGYVTGKHGSGTFVASVISQREASAAAHVPSTATHSRAWSAWSNRLAELGNPADPLPEAEIDFRHSMPDQSCFPHAIWRRIMVRESKSISLSTRYYGPAAGSPELRAALAGYLNRSRLIHCAPAQVIVTTSSQEAVGLMARVWLNEGDCVAFEEPGYARARRAFAISGGDVRSIPVDQDGMRVDLLDRCAPDAKTIFVTPSHHYPTGAILPLHRRLALIEWARRHAALIIEDDYNSEFRFGGRTIPALAGIDATTPGERSAIYAGTLSKVLFPSLRLGYLVVPPDMVERVTAAKDATNRNAPYLEQAAVAAFIQEGHFERHLARVRKLYAERRNQLIEILNDEFGERARIDPGATAAGLHLLVAFDTTIAAPEIVERARAAGVHIDSADSCYATPPPRPAFLIGYASLDESRMRAGLQRLASILVR